MRRLVVALAILAFFTSPSRAAPNIGSATAIEKDVRGESDGRTAKIGVGDAVYADEVLSTGAESRGRFVFEDRTDLQLAPSSRVKLDKFVYSNDKTAVFSATKGALRFISAPAGHKDYEIRTPNATIGVRGTSFAVRVRLGRTDAVLYDGVIEVCPIGGGACRTLDTPCTFVTVASGGATAPAALGSGDWSFDDSCKVPGRRAGETPPLAPMTPPPATPASTASPIDWSGPSFGFDAGTGVGGGEFADPVPMNGAAFLGGLRFGYSFALTKEIIAGFETDASYRSDLGGGSNGHAQASSARGGYFGTARIRLGYAFDRLLVYGTGGLAYGHIIAPRSFSGYNVIAAPYTYGTNRENPFLPGWTVGAGAQFAITDNVSVRAEYLYAKLQHYLPLYDTNTSPLPYATCTVSALHSIRVGVNYGFSLKDLLSIATPR